MSETEDLADIRRRKRAELERRLRDGPAESADNPTGQSSTPTSPQPIESANHLSEFVASHDVVLVDFYADWCGPCKMLEPTVDQLARETAAAVAKVDIDTLQGLAAEYQVRGVPTLLLFSEGELAERVVGVRDYGTLASLVASHS